MQASQLGNSSDPTTYSNRAANLAAQTWRILLGGLALFNLAIFVVSSAGLAVTRGGFLCFYPVGKLARDHFSGLYDATLQQTYVIAQGGVPFDHLPYETLLFVPLSYLPLYPAFLVWSLLSFFCIVAATIIIRRHYPKSDWIYAAAFAPTLLVLTNGQDTALLVLLAALAFDAFAKKQDIQSGIFLALGLFKFQFFIPLAAILGLRHRRLLTGFAAVSIPLLAANIAPLGKTGVMQYLTLTRLADNHESPQRLTALRGLVGSLFNSPHTWLVIALSVAMVLFAASIRTDRRALFSLAMLVSLLVSYHSHLYDDVLLLIPIAWMGASDNRLLRWAPELFLLVGFALTWDTNTNYLMVIPLGIFTIVTMRHLLRHKLRRDMTIPAPTIET